MDSEHRKVELQSPTDFTYLASKIRSTALQKLNLHLPPQADTTEPDELRKQVEDLVDDFVAQVIFGMKLNISINGIDVVNKGAGEDGDDIMDIDPAVNGLSNEKAEVEEFEPFDEKLRARLGSTVQKRDALISKTSQHRRTTPAVVAQKFEEQFSHEAVGLEEMRKEALTVETVGVDTLKRQEPVEKTWGRTVEGLGRLNKCLPETRARLERCGDVVGYLGGETKKGNKA
jgi:kinetochor protein Mis14/NSL1